MTAPFILIIPKHGAEPMAENALTLRIDNADIISRIEGLREVIDAAHNAVFEYRLHRDVWGGMNRLALALECLPSDAEPAPLVNGFPPYDPEDADPGQPYQPPQEKPE